jgi:hypothetical protein
VASLAEGGCVMAGRWDGGDESRIAALMAENERLRNLAGSLLRAYEHSRDVGNKHQYGLVARAHETLNA